MRRRKSKTVYHRRILQYVSVRNYSNVTISKCIQWRVELFAILVAEATNLFFIGLFTLEMLIKMYSVGFQGYFVSMFNRFDSFVVVCSIVEEIFTYTGNLPPLGVSVLRCARLLRVFKATRYS